MTSVGATRFTNQTIGHPEMATDQVCDLPSSPSLHGLLKLSLTRGPVNHVYQFGSGGGFSTMWNQSHAKWQSAAVAKYVAMGPTLPKFPPAGSFPPMGRATPDVAALGEGFKVYVNGKAEPVGGTSASSPTFGNTPCTDSTPSPYTPRL